MATTTDHGATATATGSARSSRRRPAALAFVESPKPLVGARRGARRPRAVGAGGRPPGAARLAVPRARRAARRADRDRELGRRRALHDDRGRRAGSRARTDDRRPSSRSRRRSWSCRSWPRPPRRTTLYGAGLLRVRRRVRRACRVLLRRANRLAAQLPARRTRVSRRRGSREDRQRIARDVHDLVAHSLTVVVLHVGGARRVLRADPSAAESALADAERVCRESLDGIRGVVGPAAGRRTRPAACRSTCTISATTYRAAGLALELEVAGRPDRCCRSRPA